MTVSSWALVIVTGVGLIGGSTLAAVKLVFKLGQVSENVKDSALTLEKVSNTIANINKTMVDHEVRIVKLETRK